MLVLLVLWLGGWLWGIGGVVLALPVLLAAKVARGMTRRRAVAPLAHRGRAHASDTVVQQ
jgi:predicted PurR-regulated permease PerM